MRRCGGKAGIVCASYNGPFRLVRQNEDTVRCSACDKQASPVTFRAISVLNDHSTGGVVNIVSPFAFADIIAIINQQ